MVQLSAIIVIEFYDQVFLCKVSSPGRGHNPRIGKIKRMWAHFRSPGVNENSIPVKSSRCGFHMYLDFFYLPVNYALVVFQMSMHRITIVISDSIG